MNKLWSLLALLVLFSCAEEPAVRATIKGEQVRSDTLVQINKRSMEMEARDIDNYIRRHELSTTETGTGVHLKFFEDVEGPSPKPEQEVLIEYTISLLNGRQCYASKAGEPEAFVVEHDQVESGLHEAVQLLSPGDSALVIIPSAMAHGLVGDLDQIPMRSTIIYNIRLLALR